MADWRGAFGYTWWAVSESRCIFGYQKNWIRFLRIGYLVNIVMSIWCFWDRNAVYGLAFNTWRVATWMVISGVWR